jgi:hypothetical protein
VAAARKRKLPGFVFDAERDGIAGIDLDGCRDPTTGEIAEWAMKIVRSINSYTEISPSGTGVKIFCRVDPVPVLRGNRRGVGKAYGSGKAQDGHDQEARCRPGLAVIGRGAGRCCRVPAGQHPSCFGRSRSSDTGPDRLG